MAKSIKNKKSPNRKRLLSKMYNGNIRQSALEDFEEQFNFITENKGKLIAFFWYWFQIFCLFPAYISDSILWSSIMLKNYFISAFRNLKRYRIHTFINLAGMSLGITFCILTFLFIKYENSFDRFHKNIDNIFLALVVQGNDGKSYVSSPPILAPTIKENIPGIESVVRVFGWFIQDGIPVKYENSVFNMSGLYVDPGFTEMFSFPEILGDSKSGLNDPNNMIISKTMAKKYFGDQDPLGKSLNIQARGGSFDFIISSVIEVPKKSSLSFDFLISYAMREKISKRRSEADWGSNNVYTFIQLVEDSHPLNLTTASSNFFETYFTDMGDLKRSQNYNMRLFPLKKLYLNNQLRKWLTLQSDPKYSYILSGIALAILIIACVNFLNLSLGLSSTRLKDVGMRKVIGAKRTDLMKQHLSESVLLSLIALGTGLILAKLLLPLFNQIMNRDILFNFQQIIFPFVGFSLVIGIISGLYPSLIVSRFQPVAIFKGNLKIGNKNSLSSGLVILQISFSIILIIATLFMSNQMQYLKNKDMGFISDQVVVIDTGSIGSGLSDEKRKKLLEHYRQKSIFHDDIISASMSSMSIGRGDHWCTGFDYDGKYSLCTVYSIDYDYLATLGIKLLQGRDFSQKFPSDENQSILINEKMAKLLAWEDPLGKRINVEKNDQLQGTIIGIVQDSHILSMHQAIGPAVYHLKEANGKYRYIYLKIKPYDIPKTLDLLWSTWDEIIPERPYVYSFMDEDVNKIFQEDERWVKLTQYSACIAIFIACLGAFGLISLTVVRRTKEVGIRKVLGASTANIFILLSREFSIFTLIANAVSWPIVYLILQKWLNTFAYQVSLEFGYFLAGGLITFIIVLATVSFQVIRAAKANPVNSLKYE